MKKFLLIIITFFPLFVFNQNFVMTWQQCYGGSADDWISSIIPHKEGYLFFGSTHSTDGDITANNCDGVGHGAAWLVNINNSGEIIFDSCYCGYSGASGRKIINIDQQGSFYATGSSGPNNTGGINGYWIAKSDTNFNIIWQDVLGGSYVEDPRGGCIAHDGGIIMSGITGSPDGDIEEHFGSFDNWLVKMNADGSRDWVKTYGNAGAEEGGEIIPTSDGGYIYACSGYNYLPGNTYCEGHDGMMAEAWLIKLNAQGEKEWHQCYGGSYIDLFRNVIELDDGYILLGFTDSADGDINNFHGIPGEINDDVWVIRINFSGEIIWSNCYGGSEQDAAGLIVQNEDNTFTIFGSTNSHNGDVQGNTAPNNQHIAWMLKIDEDGNLLYQKPFDDEPYLGVNSFIKVSDYKYIVAATKDFGCNYTWGNNNDDIYVFEIQDMDEFIPSQPTGADRVCLGVETESYYTTNLVIDTMETQWLLEPEEAGSITAMHDSVFIQWNVDFYDTAWLQVRAINEYGESSYSQEKEIIVYPALDLSGISGPDSVCTANNQQSLFTTSIVEDVYLSWYLEPEKAGDINNQQDTAIINWNPAYEGMVSLKTLAVNPCDEEEYSPIKEVLVKSCMGLQENESKELKIYPNPGKTQITFELPAITKESLLQIKDIFGKTITEIPIIRGQSQVKWECCNISSGVYFYQAEIDGINYSGKILIK